MKVLIKIINPMNLKTKFLYIPLFIIIAIVAIYFHREDLCQIWLTLTPSGNLLNAIVALTSSIIGISIPIAIGTVASRLSIYNNKYIASMFKEETTYKAMLSLILLLAIVLILFLFFYDSTKDILRNKIIGLIITIFGCVVILVFYLFIKRVTDYIIDTDDTIFQSIKNDLKNISRNVITANNVLKQIEVIEIHSLIILNKISHKSYLGINEINESMLNIIIEIYDKLHNEIYHKPLTVIDKMCNKIKYLNNMMHKCINNHINKRHCKNRILADEIHEKASRLNNFAHNKINNFLTKKNPENNDLFDDLHNNNSALIDKINAILNKYDSVIFQIWKKSYIDSPETANKILSTYEDILGHTLDERDNDYPFFIYQKILNEFQNINQRTILFRHDSSWRWYFEIIYNNNFKIKYLERVNIQLFLVFKLIISSDNKNAFDTFVSAVVDGMWNHPEPNIPFVDIEDVAQHKIVSEIKNNIFNKTTLDLETTKKLISKLDKRFDNLRKEIEDFAEAKYKFNSLQLLSAIIGSYCLFKQQNNYVQTILFYNQPRNTGIQFGNKDITPDTIETVLEWYMDKHILLRNYFILWDNHNEITVWFQKYMGILICKIIEQKPLYNEYNITETYKQKLKHTISCLDDLKIIIGDLALNEYGLNDESKEKSLEYLNNIISNINNCEESISVQQELDETKITNFENSIKSIINDSSWISILKSNQNKIKNANQFNLSVDFAQIRDKSFLSENDSGMYFGFEKSIASFIADKIDFKAEKEIRKYLYHDSEQSINKNNFKTDIFKLDSEFYIVFINYLGVFDFITNDKKFQWKYQDHLIGITNAGASIFSFKNPFDTMKKLMIFKKNDISLVNNLTEINIIDLNKDDTTLNKILAAEPNNLIDKTTTIDAQRLFLKKHLEIRICVEYYFNIKDGAHITLIENL